MIRNLIPSRTTETRQMSSQSIEAGVMRRQKLLAMKLNIFDLVYFVSGIFDTDIIIGLLFLISWFDRFWDEQVKSVNMS